MHDRNSLSHFKMPSLPRLVVTACLVLVFSADSSQLNIRERVNDAQSYLNVKPETALSIIVSLESELETAAPEVQMDAHLIALWAATYLIDEQVLSRHSQKLFAISEPQLLENNLNRILTVSAGHLWRVGDLETAHKLVLCSLEHVKTTARFLSTLLMLGATSDSKEHDAIEFINKYGEKLAAQTEQKRYQAAFLNNLGVLAITQQDYAASAEYFAKALDIRYEIAHQNGQVNSAVNLLLAHYLLQDWDKFQRLAVRTQRMLEVYNNDSYSAYFDFVHRLFLIRNKENASEEDVAALQGLLDTMRERGLQDILVDVAKKAKVELVLEPVEAPKVLDDILRYLDVCEWQDIKPMSVGLMFKKFNTIEAQLKQIAR